MQIPVIAQSADPESRFLRLNAWFLRPKDDLRYTLKTEEKHVIKAVWVPQTGENSRPGETKAISMYPIQVKIQNLVSAKNKCIC